MLSALAVTVVRGRRTLLRDVSCTLAPGRLTVLLGPNGAGKSTLLRLLAGEFLPTAGEIHLDGRPLRDWPADELARRRAVLPQDSSLQFPFRLGEVVLLGRAPHVHGAERPRDHGLVREALARVDLADKHDRIFPSLSGGEKQRGHLARALVQVWDAPGEGSRVLLLDEPTSSLDLAHQHATLRHAKRLAEQGAAVLAVLHDLNLALAYADDAWVLDGGILAAAGPASDTLTPELIRQVFAVEAFVLSCPGLSRPQLATRPLGP